MGWGPGSAYSPNDCAGTNIMDDYYEYADIMLGSPFVELGPSPQQLTFMHWYEMDTMENEGGFVEINDGGGWIQIYPAGGSCIQTPHKWTHIGSTNFCTYECLVRCIYDG